MKKHIKKNDGLVIKQSVSRQQNRVNKLRQMVQENPHNQDLAWELSQACHNLDGMKQEMATTSRSFYRQQNHTPQRQTRITPRHTAIR